MSWGGRGGGGACAERAEQLVEWKVVAPRAALRLEPWRESRVFGYKLRGRKFIGKNEQGGYVELHGVFAGHALASDLRRQGAVEGDHPRRRTTLNPGDLELSLAEAECLVGDRWRVASKEDKSMTIVIRSEASKASKAVGYLATGQVLSAAPTAADEGWLRVLGPRAGYALLKDAEHGTLLLREPKEAFNLTLRLGAPLGHATVAPTTLSVRSTSRVEDLFKLVSAELPVEKLRVEFEAHGRFFEAPAQATVHALGFLDGDELRWSTEQSVEAALDAELLVQPTLVCATGAPGVPFGPTLSVRAGGTMGSVRAALCEANGQLRDADVLPLASTRRTGKGSRLLRDAVIEDAATAWAAGLRPGGDFPFLYVGDEMAAEEEEEEEQEEEAAQKEEPPPAEDDEKLKRWWRANRTDDCRGAKNAEKRATKEVEKRQEVSSALKARGDAAFKAADFDGAVVAYTRALATCAAPTQGLALKLRANRAAALKQLGEHDGVAQDCTAVLLSCPENLKALLRRAEALEALEDYAAALEDVEKVLTLNSSKKQEQSAGDRNLAQCHSTRQRLRRYIEQGAGQRRKTTAETKASAVQCIESRRQQAEEEAAEFAAEFEDTRCVVRGCGSSSSSKSRKAPDDSKKEQHQATLIWLCGSGVELDELRDIAERFEAKTKRVFPQLKLVIASPPPSLRLTTGLRWFELNEEEWLASVLPNGLEAEGEKPSQQEVEELASIPFWCRRPPRAKVVATTGLCNADEETRKDRLLRAQLEESAEWVARLVDRELRLVDGAYVALGGWEEGAVVASHAALSRRFERGPLGCLVALNGPTPALYALMDRLDAAAAVQLDVWSIHGSHHDTFPNAAYEAQAQALSPHLKCFTSQLVPYGGLELADSDLGYVATALALTVGPYRHNDVAKVVAEDSRGAARCTTTIREDQPPKEDPKKSSSKTARLNTDGSVKRHSRKCTCTRCLDERAVEDLKAAKKNRDARVRAINEACRAAKAAAAAASQAVEEATASLNLLSAAGSSSCE